MSTLISQMEQAIQSYIEPHLGVDLMMAKSVKVTIEDQRASVCVTLGFPNRSIAAQIKQAIEERLRNISQLKDIDIQINTDILSHAVQQGLSGIPGVKNIIAVASGKGGVGKSTVAVNLALALQQEGATVGLLDADIYGPSQPHMLGATTQPQVENNKMIPVSAYGLQTMSIGYLLEQSDTPMIWRGPMVTSALQQLLLETAWQEVDYLIIDLPPGTGDIQLTMAQKIPVSGGVIVTTPQDIALLDARKGLRMFQKVNTPVLGIIENMAVYQCPHCGQQQMIFGQEGGEKIAQEYNVRLLGQLPLHQQIREQTDGGQPTVAAEPAGELAQLFREIALAMSAQLALQAKNYAVKFPKIVVE
ncbi:MAG: iron-sulfur cluster carrier protein ApbC [Legionellales bacterium]|nr:iron-sulfur cluster carrier protein ApbC [Legionellales bacterium]